jgi:hypothetical protein
VTPGRLELPTNGLGNRCSIHLSYGATSHNTNWLASLPQLDCGEPLHSVANHKTAIRGRAGHGLKVLLPGPCIDNRVRPLDVPNKI